MPIQSIPGVNLPLEAVRPSAIGAPTPATSSTTPQTPGARFVDALEQVVSETDQSLKTAETAANDFSNGRSNDIHGTMIAMQEADVRLRLLGAVRNRALEAYREVMRMGA